MDIKENPNIILILLDACRARNLGCYGYQRRISPNIDRIASEGILFKNAFSTTNVTDISLATIFSGRYPISHGVTVQAQIENMVNPGVRFLPEVLRSLGYRTLAVDWLSRFHMRGYDWYGYLAEKPTSGGIKIQALNIRNILKFLLPYEKFPESLKGFLKQIYNKIIPDWHPRWYDAQRTTDTAIKLLEKERKSKKKFFMFIHYWDTHTPYNAPKKHFSKFLESCQKKGVEIQDIIGSCAREDVKKFYTEWMKNAGSVEEVLSWYDGSISYTDEQIGRIYRFLEETSLLDDTLLIITSDHGECLLEHGIYFDHHGALYDEVLHVPLIIRYPKRLPKNKEIEALVQHTDILPTILELLGEDWNHKDEGVSLLSVIKDNEEVREYVYAVMDNEERYSIRTLNYKYIKKNLSKDSSKKYRDQQGFMDEEELYDLQEDPRELTNISGDQPEIKNELDRVLRLHLRSQKEKTKSPEMESKNEEMDEEEKQKLKERLRSLGYLG
jgi:arylsulfatase A-like enzyme